MPRRRKPVGNKAKKEYLKRKRRQKREKKTSSNVTETISNSTENILPTLSSSLLRSHYSTADTNRRKLRAQEGLSRKSPTLTHKSNSSLKLRVSSLVSASLPFFSRPDSSTKSAKELDEIETEAFRQYVAFERGITLYNRYETV